jgi:seryl-tRNA synthetase
MVKAACKNRNKQLDDIIDEILSIDAQRRELSSGADELKAQQNRASREIPAIKKAGGDVSAVMEEMKKIAERVGELNSRVSELEERQLELALSIPNIPDESVPVGQDDGCNVEIRRWGNPVSFPFVPSPLGHRKTT